MPLHHVSCTCGNCGYLPLFANGPKVDTQQTSREALESIQDALPNQEQEVRDFIASRAQGATDDEVEEGCGLSHQSASARRNGLMRKGKVRVMLDGKGKPVKRATRSGRAALVWVVV